MQLLAMLTMLIDHIGIVFFPDNTVLRLIGRIAFPLYAYGIAAGIRYTSNRVRYARRLAIIAAAAQIPYMLALDTWGVNVVGTFVVVAGVIWLYERRADQPIIWISAMVLACVVMDGLKFDYGSYALLLILIYRYVPLHWMVAAHMGLNVLYLFYASWQLQLASVLATCLLVYGQPLLQAIQRYKIPRWLWLSFYPAHLLLLYLSKLIWDF